MKFSFPWSILIYGLSKWVLIQFLWWGYYCQSVSLSVQPLSHVPLFVTPWTAAHRPPCPSPNPRACSNSWALIHPTISSSVIPFSSCLQSSPASGSFPMSQFFASGGKSIEASASTLVLPMNIQDWFPLGWTSWISRGLSRVFSNTTFEKHQFFSAQLSLRSKSHMHTWLLERVK